MRAVACLDLREDSSQPVLSIENLTRLAEDIQPLEVIDRKTRDLPQHLATVRSRRRLCAVGRLDALPLSLRRTVAEAERATAVHEGCRLNIAVGYSGPHEITDAVRALVRERFHYGMTVEDLVTHITPEAIRSYVCTVAGRRQQKIPAPGKNRKRHLFAAVD